MTVAELIAKLQELPPETKVLAMVADYGYAPTDDVDVRWARPDERDWWHLYWSPGPPKFSMGFEQVVIIS